MGIKWLTSYVAEIERSISSEVTFPVQDNAAAGSSQDDRPTFVVDAWAFIFRVWLKRFGDAVGGLDMQAYKQIIVHIVKTWSAAGIQSIFVFDGPMLPVKLPTLIERRAKIAASNQAYIKSSAQSRASRRFQSDCGVIPPTLMFATVDALKQAGATARGGLEHAQGSSTTADAQVQIIFAPTEADSLVAEIAARKPKGYAISQDSDYFVLCARGRGTEYVPLDSIEYVVELPVSKGPIASQEKVEPASANPGDVQRDAELAAALARGDVADTMDLNDGFEQVTTRKRGGRRQQAATPFIASNSSRATSQALSQFPPLPFEEGSVGKTTGVRIRAYRSHDLASHLQLSPTLLPLLAAIIGNDYSSALQTQLLLKHVWGSQRVTLCANILREEWIRVKGGVGGRLGKRDATRSSSVQTRRGNGRGASLHSSPRPGTEDDESRSDIGSSATATPTARSMGASTPFDPVRNLVEAVVDRALADTINYGNGISHVASGERAKIIDSVIEGAAAYSLLTQSNAPHLASPSALFFGERTATLAPYGSVNGNTNIAHPDLIARYRAAYEQGRFNPLLVEAMTQRVYLSSLMPEAADMASVQKTSAHTLRAWIYAVLFEAWGMHWAREQWEEPITNMETDSDDDDVSQTRGPIRFGPDRTYREGEQPDDVISVHTESSESGEEEKEFGEHDELPSRPASVHNFGAEEDDETKPAPGVNEYVRAGSSYNRQLARVRPLATLLRYGTDLDPSFDVQNVNAQAEKPEDLAENVPSSLAGLLSSEGGADGILRLPTATRLDLFWHAHKALTPAIRALPSELWLIASALRLLLVDAAERIKATGARVRDNWSRSELSVAVHSALAAQQKATSADIAHDNVGNSALGSGAMYETPAALASARATHLGSTLQLTMQTSAFLAQALLLTVPSDASNGSTDHIDAFSTETLAHPENAFDGPSFYVGMARIHDGVDDDDEDAKPAPKNTGAPSRAEVTVARTVDAITEGVVEFLGMDALDLKRERKAKKRQAREQKLAAGQQETASAAAAKPPSRANGPAKPVRGGKSNVKRAANAFALLDDMTS